MNKNLYTTHGGIPVYNIMISHSWHEIGAVLQLIYEYQVDRFVEIGFHRGGLGTLMVSHCQFDTDFRYLGFDIDKNIVEPSFINVVAKTPNADAYFQDALTSDSVEDVVRFLRFARQPMIYCDGGNKVAEFEIYSEIIRPGGLIMVHDYPIEFREEHFEKVTWMRRLEKEYLDEFNRQILFERI